MTHGKTSNWRFPVLSPLYTPNDTHSHTYTLTYNIAGKTDGQESDGGIIEQLKASGMCRSKGSVESKKEE